MSPSKLWIGLLGRYAPSALSRESISRPGSQVPRGNSRTNVVQDPRRSDLAAFLACSFVCREVKGATGSFPNTCTTNGVGRKGHELHFPTLPGWSSTRHRDALHSNLEDPFSPAPFSLFTTEKSGSSHFRNAVSLQRPFQSLQFLLTQQWGR